MTEAERRAVMLARETGVPLAEAVTAWARSHGKAHGVLFGELIEARLESSASDALSDPYRYALKRLLTLANSHIGQIPASEVGSAEVASVVSLGKSSSWQKQMRAMLSGVFNQAIRAGILATNHATLARVMRQYQTEPVTILSPPEAGALLTHAMTTPLFVPVAIQLFAGLRRAEANRLDWSEVNLDRGFIEVTAGKSKTKTRRLVTIQPNLAQLLTPLAQKSGPVWTASEREEKAFRSAVKIPPNSMRHSFVSYHLARFGDVSKTELEAGHDKKVLFGHYRELVTPDEAKAFFALPDLPADEEE